MNTAIGETESRSGRIGEVEDALPTSVCVVGLGYVGLPLAVGFDRAGHTVTGLDVDDTKVETLRRGVDTTSDLGDSTVAESEVRFTTDPARIGRADYVVIAVPTPVDETKTPDLSYVEAAGRTVGEHLSPGTTVVLESTVYPGTTRETLVPALAATSGLTCGEDFFVAYSPERATPGDEAHDLRSVVKVVGGQTVAVREHVAALYETVVDAGVHRAPSIEVAEAAKVVENVQRDLNIALMNELAMAFERMDVDVDTHAVLEAAGTKWNFHDYRPGLVGGHCIPVDPYFFAYQAERGGHVPQLTLAAREVNETMPAYVGELTIKALSRNGKALGDSRVLVLGFAYKPGVADVRSSKVADIVGLLAEYGVEVVGTDPYADDDLLRDEFGVEVQADPDFEGVDAVVLATPHQAFLDLDLDDVAAALNDDPALIDVTRALDGARVAAAGIDYRSV